MLNLQILKYYWYICILPYFVFTLFYILGPGLYSADSQSRPAFLTDEATYVWPTNASNYKSSSFGETRAAHFHAAMDIGTWGQEGYAVFATRDGIVHRVAVGPVGYGNVIYLRHDDGSISLYAHLKDFHPYIRNKVDSLRLQNYSFQFDSNMESYNIHFRQGQQIGWTGSTGVGPPHLHFELRTPDGNPFNPLLAGIRIDDTIAPRFSGLAIEPLSPESRINGKGSLFRSRPALRNGQYDFGIVDIQGEVGLAVDVFDRANASNNTHAVYEISMFVNNERYFHSRADSFSYHESRQMFLDRIYPLLVNERKGFQRLYIRSGNTLPFYSATGHSGRLKLPAGTHHIQIIASDFFGNKATAAVQLNVTDSDIRENVDERLNIFSDIPSLQANFEPSDLLWHKNWVLPVTTYKQPDQNKEFQTNGNELQSNAIFNNPDDNFWAIRELGSFQQEQRKLIFGGHGLPLNGSDRLELRNKDSLWFLHQVHPESPLSIYHDNMGLVIHFPSNSFFSPVTLGIAGTRNEFTLFPNIEPFQRPATVRILLDETQNTREGLGLYLIDLKSGRLKHISSYRNSRGDALVGTIQSGGFYAIRADTTAPSISEPKFGRWQHSRLHFVTVNIEDDMSGIDYQSAEFYVNGLRGIAEYDPEKNLLRYHHPDFKPENLNLITIRLSDQAGNTTEMTFRDVPYN